MLQIISTIIILSIYSICFKHLRFLFLLGHKFVINIYFLAIFFNIRYESIHNF